MTVDEYKIIRTKAGICSICRREPSIAAYEQRRRDGVTTARIGICERCDIRSIPGSWVYVGPENSYYAINEVAKTDLMVMLVDIIANKNLFDSMAAIGKVIRRKRPPKRLQRIIDQYRRREAVLNLFSEQCSECVASDEPESVLEQVLFKHAGKITVWLIVIIVSMLSWMLFAQLLMWMTGYK